MPVVLGREMLPAGTEIRKVAVAHRRTIWLATNKGVARVRNGEVRLLGRKDGAFEEQVYDLAATPQGVFAATKSGLRWVEEIEDGHSSFNPLHFSSSVVRSVQIDGDSLWVWISSGSSVIHRLALEGGRLPLDRRQLGSIAKPLRDFFVADGGGVLLYPDGADCKGAAEKLVWGRAVPEGPDGAPALPPGSGDAAPAEVVLDSDPVGVASRPGLTAILDDKQLHVVRTGDGAVDSIPLPPSKEGGGCVAAAADEDSFWIGRSGLLLQVNARERAIRRRIALPARGAPRSIAQLPDDRGRLWLAMDHGLWMVDLRPRGAKGAAWAVDPPGDPDRSREPAVSDPSRAGFTSDGRVWSALGPKGRFFDDAGSERGASFEVPREEILQALGEDGRSFVMTAEGAYRIDGEKPAKLPWSPPPRDRSQGMAQLQEMERRDTLLDFLRRKPALAPLLARLGSDEVLRGLDSGDDLLETIQGELGEAALLRAIRDSTIPRVSLREGALAIGVRGTDSMRLSLSPVEPDPPDERQRVAEVSWSRVEEGPASVVPAPSGFLAVSADGKSPLQLDLAGRVTVLPKPMELPRSTLALFAVPGKSDAKTGWSDPLAAEMSGGDFAGRVWAFHEGAAREPWQLLLDAPTGEAWILGLARSSGADAQRVFGACFGCNWRMRLFEVPPTGPLRPLPLQDEIEPRIAAPFLVDRRGDVWIGTRSGLLAGPPDGVKAPVEDPDGLPLETPSAMIEDAKGRIWLTARRGLHVLEAPETRRVSRSVALDHEVDRLAAFAATNAPNAIWAAGGALSRVDPDDGFAVKKAEIDLSAGERWRSRVMGMGVQHDRLLLGLEDRVLAVMPDGTVDPKPELWSARGSASTADWKLHRTAGGAMIAARLAGSPNHTELFELTPKGWTYRHKLSFWATSILDVGGDLLAGTNDGKIWKLQRWKPGTSWSARVENKDVAAAGEHVSDKLVSLCPLSGGETLLALRSLRDSRTKKGGGSQDEAKVRLVRVEHGAAAGSGKWHALTFAAGVEPPTWESCAVLSDGADARVALAGSADFEDFASRLRYGILTLKKQEGNDDAAVQPASSGGPADTAVPGSTSRHVATGPLLGSARPNGDVWVFSGSAVFKLHEDGQWEKIDGPPRTIDASRASLSVDDGGGLWLAAHEQGLWRLDPEKEARPGQEECARVWRGFDERDGLPSSTIQQVVPVTPSRAVVLTAAGPAEAVKERSAWGFQAVQRQPISGELAAIEMFDLADLSAIAVGTDQGLHILFWPRDAGDASWWRPGETSAPVPVERQWTHVDRADGLPDRKVTALAFEPRKSELWVGTSQGLVILKLSKAHFVEGGHVTIQVSGSTTFSDVTGRITDIRLDPLGEHGWTLSDEGGRGRIHWFRRVDRSMDVSSVPLPSISEAQLGPARRGANDEVIAPKIALRDDTGTWSIWPLSDMLVPEVEASHSSIGIRVTEARLRGVDPAAVDLSGWTLRYHLDSLAGRGDTLGLFTPDYFGAGTSHLVIAEYRRKSDGLTLYADVPVEPATPFSYWTRRGVLAFAIAVVLGTGVGLFLRRRAWRKRIARNEIPYIQGGVVRDGGMFFGRADLLQKLRDTVATTSYALVGHYRIGKTSIQFQLARMLEELRDPTYVFVPVFIDLQHLGKGNGDALYHFIAQRLVPKCQSLGIPQEALDKLDLASVDAPADYDSIAFEHDVEMLVEQLRTITAPKKPVILLQIDEISLLEDVDYDILLGFRAVLVKVPELKTVMTGRFVPQKDHKQSLSPWYNFFLEREVVPLTPGEARRLITKPAEGLFRFTDEAIEEILARAELRPFDIQKICAGVLVYKYQAKRLDKIITVQDLRASLAPNSPPREDGA